MALFNDDEFKKHTQKNKNNKNGKTLHDNVDNMLWHKNANGSNIVASTKNIIIDYDNNIKNVNFVASHDDFYLILSITKNVPIAQKAIDYIKSTFANFTFFIHYDKSQNLAYITTSMMPLLKSAYYNFDDDDANVNSLFYKACNDKQKRNHVDGNHKNTSLYLIYKYCIAQALYEFYECEIVKNDFHEWHRNEIETLKNIIDAQQHDSDVKYEYDFNYFANEYIKYAKRKLNKNVVAADVVNDVITTTHDANVADADDKKANKQIKNK